MEVLIIFVVIILVAGMVSEAKPKTAKEAPQPHQEPPEYRLVQDANGEYAIQQLCYNWRTLHNNDRYEFSSLLERRHTDIVTARLDLALLLSQKDKEQMEANKRHKAKIVSKVIDP